MASARDMTMLMVGDVFVLRDDPPSVFRHVKALMRSADFVLGNLEGTVCDVGNPPVKPGAKLWKSDSRQLAAIEAAGFHAMNVANNHMLSFGADAMQATLANLDRIGVKHCGGGRNIAEAHAPAIVERDGCKLAMLGYTSVFKAGWAAGADSPGVAVIGARTSYEPPKAVFEAPGSPPVIRTAAIAEHKARLAQDIAAARARADIVVCSFHWGLSSGFKNLAEYQVEVGRFAIDSGADLVFGHHPHLLQGIETYKGRAICYSLGNFTYAKHQPHKGHEYETGLLRCRIRNGKISAVDFLPARGDQNVEPRVLNTEEGRDVVELVKARSKDLGTVFVETKDALQVIRE
jgi:poly-gamma-glutamate capsule biosynthesis protein CapA/YwtB (metallophosphatase superfamily)